MTSPSDRLEEICQGAQPRVLDLFAGCGGLSLGLQAAGFDIVGCVEREKNAAATHAQNFFKHLPAEKADAHSQPRDITKTSPEELADELGLGSVEGAIDVIVGGPPCQAFARIGRAKLRDLHEHPEAYLQDPRSDLYLRYLEYVQAFRPLAVLVENVPEFLNYGGHNLAEEMCEVLEKDGYSCRYTLLNSARYGVPQFRERVFLIALASSLGTEPTFPTPTHKADVPSGYKGARTHALSRTPAQPDLFGYVPRYVDPPATALNARPAVTAQEAIGDLPENPPRSRPGQAYDLHQPELFPISRSGSTYAQAMKNWRSTVEPAVPSGHVTRHLPRDYPIFREMESGDEYPEALTIALRIFEEQRALLGAQSDRDDEALRRKVVPPYPADKFKSKWWKIEPALPSRTLTAHLSKDTYSHIHYSDKEARTITPREAARLQSFPDGFVFEGGLNSAFRQIGNSVPPLLAKALGETILACLQSHSRRT